MKVGPVESPFLGLWWENNLCILLSYLKPWSRVELPQMSEFFADRLSKLEIYQVFFFKKNQSNFSCIIIIIIY